MIRTSLSLQTTDTNTSFMVNATTTATRRVGGRHDPSTNRPPPTKLQRDRGATCSCTLCLLGSAEDPSERSRLALDERKINKNRRRRRRAARARWRRSARPRRW
eukprot:4293541-Prymnesium_polylepis.1